MHKYEPTAEDFRKLAKYYKAAAERVKSNGNPPVFPVKVIYWMEVDGDNE